MDLETFRWLLTDDGQRLLAEATALVADGADALAAGAALRRTATGDRAAAVLTQVDLRARAAAKFGERAQRMYFTPEALEQATRRRVAEHRAGRLTAFEATSLVDLGCGIGGDLLAAAETGIVCAGVDTDPVRVAIAEANLAALGLAGAVQVADATAIDHTAFDIAFADPARRTGAGRSFRVEDWSPPWPWVQSLLERDACVKVAPGIPHALVPDGVEAEWVSDAGEVKEAALWAGRTATAARRATVIPASGGLATLTEDDDPGPAAVGTRPVGDFLYEPDGAVIRAGLVTAVAAGVGGGLVDRRIAYVTSDEAFSTPFARGFRVLEELPYREKQLRAALRERNIGTLTIKKRGVDVAPDALRKRLALAGEEEATVVLTRVAGEGTALLVSPF